LARAIKLSTIKELDSITFDFTTLHPPQMGRDCKPHPAWWLSPTDNNQLDNTVPSWGLAFLRNNLLRPKKTADLTQITLKLKHD
jgi:hypothetical protein